MSAHARFVAKVLGGLAMLGAFSVLPTAAFAGPPSGGGYAGGGYGGGHPSTGGGGGTGCCKPTPQPPCCKPTPGHDVHVPGVKVYPPQVVIVPPSITVNASANAYASASASANANGSGSGSGFGSGIVFIGGGGGGGGGSVGGTPAVLPGLNVEGVAAQIQRIPYQATRTQVKTVVIQAVCVDDRQVPHPASQAFPGQDVAESFDGELYRCIAGTRLQATIADYLGRISFDGGQTLVCTKGQALFHGAGGKLECRTQRPARDCNERSLLRRYGVGVKILKMVRVETYTAYREETIQSATTTSGGIILDGGVGGIQF